MEKVRYMISDAARMVALEQHVLRYWEEELDLDIPRNEMGHRYYTDENIKEILRIKDLRDKGYQLKAIRMYLKKEKRKGAKEQDTGKDPVDLDGFVTITSGEELGLHPPIKDDGAVTESVGDRQTQQSQIKMDQFRRLMTEIVADAMKENNETLTTHVEERILKEMNYLMQEHYQMEEDHFRKLDEIIRGNLKKKRNPSGKWIFSGKK